MPRTAIAYPAEPLAPPARVRIVDTVTGPAVAAALTPIAAGQADTLLLPRLGDAARSLPELIRLLDWLSGAQATLIALDVNLDTGTATGARMVGLLREVDRWSRTGGERPPRGRPGLSTASPAVAERIAQLRAQGLSLRAIATQLNQEGVPTPRGGAEWRASSVQSAIGYRRPRPPLPGAPPPPPRRRAGGPRPKPAKPLPGPPGPRP